MSTALEEAKTLIDHLPQDSSIEDIQYHLYVLEKIRKGQQDIQNGKTYTTEEAKERLNQWLKP